MMSEPSGRFAVVKFVPDSARFEPINVGLVLEAGGRVLTRMAESVDPRIRYADPYADLASFLEFLRTFDAEAAVGTAGSVITALTDGRVAVPNFYFDGAHPFDAAALPIVDAGDVLFDRLVRRTFEAPPGFSRPSSPTAARTALRRAFAGAKALGTQVRPGVERIGASGITWEVDFEYLTREYYLVQTATTGLKEDLRRSEHAFRAFATLVDLTHEPGRVGVLASDESPDRNDLSGQLASMAHAHGFRFVGGQRAMLSLASEVRREAQPISREIESGPAQLVLL